MNARKRILMVTPRYWPSIGGIETHLEKLIQELIGSGFEISVLTYAHERQIPLKEKNNSVTIFRIPFGYERNPPLVYSWLLRERKNFTDYDIVHVHGSSPLLFWYFPLIIVKSTTPVYATFHGFERDPVPTKWKVIRKIANLLTRGSMCIGPFIEDIYGIQCDEISFGGVNRHKREIVSRDGAIFVGRLEIDTGILEHLDAIRILKEEYGISISIDVCGSGSLKQMLINFSSSNNIDVRFHGTVVNPQSMMNGKSLCLAAGYLSILEAMSLGLPVIGITRTPLKAAYLKGIRSMGAPISIQTSSKGVAKELHRITKNPNLYNSISRRGQAFADKMSWCNVAKAYLRVWMKS